MQIFEIRSHSKIKPRSQEPFLSECHQALHVTPRSTDFSRFSKTLYRRLVERVASDPLRGRLSLSLAARLVVGELRSFWFGAPVEEYLTNPEFSFTQRLMRKAVRFSNINFKAGLAEMPDSSPVRSWLRGNVWVRLFPLSAGDSFWDQVDDLAAPIDPEHLVSINLAYVCDNVLPPWSGVNRLVFLTLLTVARMWLTRMEGILQYGHYSLQVLGISSRWRS